MSDDKVTHLFGTNNQGTIEAEAQHKAPRNYNIYMNDANQTMVQVTGYLASNGHVTFVLDDEEDLRSIVFMSTLDAIQYIVEDEEVDA